MSRVLQPLLYGIIRKFYDQRIEQHKSPAMATTNEIFSELRIAIERELDEMIADGVVKRNMNINGIGMYAPVNADITTPDK